MNFDANLFLNFFPVIISILILIIVTSFTIFYKLKQRWPVKVNCWFCNNYAKIPKYSLDWWLCSHCEQYNGFSEDGDYNYEIPEQHKIAEKNRLRNESYCQRKNFSPSQNSLCTECNRKEELKLLKLRELESSMDVHNDKKIARFEKSFEQKYPLCLKCQSIVQNVLHRQALWLTQYKMLLFKQKPIRRIIENKEKIERILRIALSILASVAIYFTEVWYLPLCGIFFQLAAYLASPTNKRQSDIFPILGWVCLIWVKAFSTSAVLKIFKIHSNDNLITVDDSTYQYFIITLGTVIGIANLKFQSHKTISNESLSFKKLESPNNRFSRSPSPETKFSEDEELFSHSKPIRNLYSPVNITKNLISPISVETPIPLKPTKLPQWSFEESQNPPLCHISSKSSTFASDTESCFSKSFNNQSYSLNDSLNSLNSLSLGTNHKTSLLQSPKVFETKVYGTTSPDLFNKNYYNQKRSILAQPKLHSVTRTSWVAGGYWQSGIDMPTLSRSSSQSSGFGSSGSNYGPSREPSIHEFDQCSVISEQCYFARPESPLSSRNSTMIRKQNNNHSPRCSQIMNDHCVNETVQHHIANESQCKGHTTTIVTHPVWLPVLLCGSLLFNMVVLCTILLR